MVDKMADFFLRQSFKIMIAGFVISAAGVIMFIKMQHKDRVLENTAFTIAAIGIGLWLIGRIGIILQQRKARKQREQALRDSSD
jgi:glucose uptake protein GlcU